MKKFFKKIFSRFPLVALTIIALILVFFAVLFGGWYFAAYVLTEVYPVSERIVTAVVTVLDDLILIIAVVNDVFRALLGEFQKVGVVRFVVEFRRLGHRAAAWDAPNGS